MARLRRDPVERFWTKVNRLGPDDCWEWTGVTVGAGHGQMWDGDRKIYAHRFSFILHGGVMTADRTMVCHHCDNPPCVNPAHLYAGNAQTNADDMWARNREGTLLGKARPDVTVKHQRAYVSRHDGIITDLEDVRWWFDLDYAAGLRDAEQHAARVNRGDAVDINCRWMDAIA